MPKILFTEDRVVRDEHTGTDKETKFEKGKVYDLPPPSAERWKKRGAAIDAPEDKPAPKAAPAKSEQVKEDDDAKSKPQAAKTFPGLNPTGSTAKPGVSGL